MGSGFSRQKKQAKLFQEQLNKMQQELSSIIIEGKAPNDLVSLKLNGEHELIAITIKPECVDPNDIEGLEDLITLAHKDALKKLREETAHQMPTLPGMPGMF